MTPALALTIAFIVIVLMLRQCAVEADVSRYGTWLATVWMGIVGSRMISLWFPADGLGGPTADAYLTGSTIDREVFGVLIVLGLVGLFARRASLSVFVSQNKWLVVLVIYSALAITWSDYPFTSLKRYVKEIGNLVVIGLLVSERASWAAYRTVFRRVAIVLVPLSWVLIKYYPTLGRSYHRYTGELSITGVSTGKNNLAALCMLCSLYLLYELISWWRGREQYRRGEVWTMAGVLMLAVTLLVRASSATSLACFAVGSALLLALERESIAKRTRHLAVYVAVVAVIGLVGERLFGVMAMVAEWLGRDATLTGRTALWGDVLAMAGNSAFGVGYDSFWLGPRLTELWSRYWWGPTQAHSGYVEVWIELGFVGLVLYVCFLGSALSRAGRALAADAPGARLRVTLLVVALFYNLTESAFKGLDLVWFALLLSSLEYQPQAVPREERALAMRSGRIGLAHRPRPGWAKVDQT